jgi:trehalose-6-phosphate synthase
MASSIAMTGGSVAELPSTGRVLIVSNRLPVTVRESARGMDVVPSSGGLASGLRAYYESSAATWIGWPGPASTSLASRRVLEEQLTARHLRAVPLDQRDIDGYYDGFSNGVVWPLFHYLLDRIPLRSQNWDAYRRVNERFAAAVADEYQPGDVVWVHDYHLMLVPGLVREQCPDAKIGFFLHIPFPAPEVFRILPWRRELLMGVLGADLVGFHTPSYAQHFASAVRAQGGLDAAHDRVRVDGRTVRIGSSGWHMIPACSKRRRASARIRRAASSFSVSIGSTTPKVFRDAWLRSSACCSATPACATPYASSRWRCRRAARSAPMPASANRSKSWSVASTARWVRWIPCRSTICTAR